MTGAGGPPVRICVVGSGFRFTSGISYYTCRLSSALAERYRVSAVLMRRLIPRAFYPGRSRVGRSVHSLDYAPSVRVFDGIDWYWGPSMWRALRFLRAERPDVVVLQWWTGAVAHSYYVLIRAALRQGATVVIEFHETQDTGEAALPGVARYTSAIASRLIGKAHGFVFHSDFDRALVEARFGAVRRPSVIAPHGPYNQYARTPVPRAEGRPVRLLFFGTIRPYKGLETLIEAFDSLDANEAAGFELDIVGETWEGWTEPVRAAEQSPHRDRMRIVNRYVTDDEVAEAFARADAVVLPYVRSSSSGPLHIAMACGKPVILSRVGGLVEAASGYEGVVWTEPQSVESLREAILGVGPLVGRTFDDPRSWDDTVDAYTDLLDDIREAEAAR